MSNDDDVLDGRTKGLPGRAAGIRLAEIGAQGWRLLNEDLPLPVAVLRTSVLDANMGWMRRFTQETGALLAPHGKTSMSPALFARQIAAGAWGMTVASVQQMRVARQEGIGRIVIANELVGRDDIISAFQELAGDPELELYCLVDSAEGVAILDRSSRTHRGPPLRLLVECGYSGGRTGCRDLAGALAVARAVRGAGDALELHGVEGFEGLLQSHPKDEVVPRVDAFLRFMLEVARACDGQGLFDAERVILSAGGSAYYDRVAEILGPQSLSRPSQLVLRAGCYLTQDSGIYLRNFRDIRGRSETARQIAGDMSAALELWAYVSSVPEPDFAVLGAGRRDFGEDSGRPVPLKWFRPGVHQAPLPVADGMALIGVSDQHAHVRIPEGAVRVGDMVALGVSHPCTTFDKWRLIYLVDDDYNVVSAIRTYF